MDYLSSIPSELLNILGLYLNYNETLVLRSIFPVKFNYQYLLSEKYPGFYQIFNTVKKRDVKYESMAYEEAYEIIDLTEKG